MEQHYYQPEIECADRETILALQNDRLVKQVRHIWDNVPYYRAKMEEKGTENYFGPTRAALNLIYVF